MILFNRQGIPASLLYHYCEDNSNELNVDHDNDLNVKYDSEMEFEDDVCTLRSYSLNRMRDAAGGLFEMY